MLPLSLVTDLLNQVQPPDPDEWDDPNLAREMAADDLRDKSYAAGYKSGQLRGEIIRAVSDQDYLDGWWDGWNDANEWDED